MDTHVTTNGRVVIPVAIRRKLGIRPGTRIRLEVDEQAKRIILSPITREYIHHLRGKHRGQHLLEALMAEKKREKEC